jgi:Flp pilus assembly protein TadB
MAKNSLERKEWEGRKGREDSHTIQRRGMDDREVETKNDKGKQGTKTRREGEWWKEGYNIPKCITCLLEKLCSQISLEMVVVVVMVVVVAIVVAVIVVAVVVILVVLVVVTTA